MAKKRPFGSVSVLAYIRGRLNALKPEELVNTWGSEWDGEPEITFIGEATDQMRRLGVLFGQLRDQMAPIFTRIVEIEALVGTENLTAELIEEHDRIVPEYNHLERLSTIVTDLLLLEIHMEFDDFPSGQRVAIDHAWRVGWSRKQQPLFTHTVEVFVEK